MGDGTWGSTGERRETERTYTLVCPTAQCRSTLCPQASPAA